MSFWASLFLTLAVVLGAWWGWQAFRKAGGSLLAPRQRWALVTMRSLGLLALTLLLINPACSERSPDSSAYWVAVLSDQSSSMGVADMPGNQTRAAVLSEALDPERAEAWRSTWAQAHRLRVYGFAENLREGTSAIGGPTALGQALVELKEATAAQPPAAIILLTDGRNVTGPAPLAAARLWHQQGVPISALAMGQPSPPADIGVRWDGPPETAPPDVPLELPFAIEGKGFAGQTVTARLRSPGLPEQTQELSLGQNGSAQGVFTVSAPQPGQRLFEISIAAPQTDANALNDRAATLVEITPPPERQVLYLADELTPEFRALRQALQPREDLRLQAVIELGQGRVWATGFEDELPAYESLAQYLGQLERWLQADALVVPAGCLGRWPAEAREALRQFVNGRGGGLLIQGSPLAVPEDLRSILPAREARPLPPGVLPLEVAGLPVFERPRDAVLWESPALARLGQAEAFALEASALGARALLSGPRAEVLLSGHRFGAGRVAVLGLTETWLWRLHSDRDFRRHDAFWQALAGWLGTGGRERLEPSEASVRSTLGQATPLAVRVRTPDYQPEAGAQVKAQVLDASGAFIEEVELLPDARQPGAYQAAWVPAQEGLYSVTYRAERPDGEVLRAETALHVGFDARERENLTPDAATLRDVTRLTGGRFAWWEEGLWPAELPLHEAVPEVVQTIHWTRQGWFFMLLVTAWLLEWWLRRRWGLL